MAKRVFLSPSDHGEGKNKCLHSGCYEDKHTRAIAEACAKYLQASGIEVKIGAANQSLNARCEDSDAFGADLHVPIHTNAAKSASARYLMFMFYADNKKYRKLFDAVAPELEAIYPNKIKSVFDVRTDLAEVVSPNAMTLYCELGFHTNKTDCDKFIHNADAAGKALAKGICKYYGITYKEPKKEQKTCKVTLPVLKKGDSGEYVKTMQLLLIGHGHNLSATGNYGNGTEKALHAFKKKVGLAVTSNCGEKTWSALLDMR